jgi:hypothetical protein
MRWAVLLCAVTVGVSCAYAAEEVIWWQVPTDPDVTTFHEGVKSASGLGVTDARIRASDGNYLVIPPPDQESIEVPMTEGAWFALLPSSPEGLSFMVELGNWESGTWTGIATSQSYTYAQLQSYIIHEWSGPGATPAIEPWVAGGYVVPEPSSGLLLLIGGGLLALRRKRRG